jgi:hypothetical protein
LLAGFYFNDALYRIAATAERLGKLEIALLRAAKRTPPPHWSSTYGTDFKIIKKIRKEVDHLKHDGEGTSEGRKVFMRDAFQAFSVIVSAAARVFGHSGASR